MILQVGGFLRVLRFPPPPPPPWYNWNTVESGVKHYNSNTYHPIQIYVIQDTSTNKNDRNDIAEKLLKVTLNTITLTLTLESKIVLFRANIKRRLIFSCTRHVSGMTFVIIRYSRPTVLLIWFPLVIQSMFQVYDRNTITWLSQSNKLWWLLNKRSEGVNS